MGRGLVIISTAMIFIFGMVQMGIVNRHNVEAGININYGNWVQARNVAWSGADLAILNVNNGTWAQDNGEFEFLMDGTVADIEVLVMSGDASLAANQMRIISQATMGGRTARVNVLLEQGGNMPTIEGAIGIYTEGVDFTANGTAFTISGEDGQTDNELMKYGIAVGENRNEEYVNEAYEEVINSIGNHQIFQVQGKDGPPSIAEVDNINDDLIELAAIYAAMAKDPNFPYGMYYPEDHDLAAQETLGSKENPQITYVKEGMTLTLTGGASGGGVLVLGQDATLIMKGGGNKPFNFYGLVIVLGSASVRGNMEIDGALMFGGESDSKIDVEFSGNIGVKYSSQAMAEINTFLDDSGWEFNRVFRMVSVFE